MFRDLYKKANDEIKGDRAILDKAFLQAAQPVKKKSPVFKYSFVGTAVAAVMVIGAVFANPTVFTNKSETIGVDESSAPTENVAVFTTEADNVTAENSEIAIVSSIEEEDETPINTADTTKVTTPKPKSGSQKAVGSDNEETFENDYGLTVMSLEDEADAFVEAATEGQVMFKITRPFRNTEEATEEMTEEVSEEAITTATEETVRNFSYMYDKSVYKEGDWGVVSEGFVNTDISPITNSTEAIERAKNECTVEYTIAIVFRDSIEDMWMVNFATDAPGGDQSVYMNSDGITQLIVYGE